MMSEAMYQKLLPKGKLLPIKEPKDDLSLSKKTEQTLFSKGEKLASKKKLPPIQKAKDAISLPKKTEFELFPQGKVPQPKKKLLPIKKMNADFHLSQETDYEPIDDEHVILTSGELEELESDKLLRPLSRRVNHELGEFDVQELRLSDLPIKESVRLLIKYLTATPKEVPFKISKAKQHAQEAAAALTKIEKEAGGDERRLLRGMFLKFGEHTSIRVLQLVTAKLCNKIEPLSKAEEAELLAKVHQATRTALEECRSAFCDDVDKADGSFPFLDPSLRRIAIFDTYENELVKQTKLSQGASPLGFSPFVTEENPSDTKLSSSFAHA